MNFLPFKVRPALYVNLAIKISFVFITSRVLQIEIENFYVHSKCLFAYTTVKFLLRNSYPLMNKSRTNFFSIPLFFSSCNREKEILDFLK